MKGLSTETALLEVLNSVYTAANDNQVTIPGLDIPAAFDMSANRLNLNACILSLV